MVNSYLHINTNDDWSYATAVRLVRVIINKKGASSNRLDLYDGVDANGSLIASIDTTEAAKTLDYDVVCNRGGYAVMHTGTAADVTIVFN